MLGYYADNRRFGRFGFRTEERSLAMKRRDTVYKALCGVGILALVVPFVAYACIIVGSTWDAPWQSSGPPTYADFHWIWTVTNTHPYEKAAEANPARARYRREVAFWFDQTMWWTDPDPTYNWRIPPGITWDDSEDTSPIFVMVYPNKYHWDWNSWYVGTSDNTVTMSRGTGHTYNCNVPGGT
jgi:hypothetical protein